MNGSNDLPALGVYSQSERVGTLTFSEPAICSFVYADAWNIA
jgi:hypothetical protein